MSVSRIILPKSPSDGLGSGSSGSSVDDSSNGLFGPCDSPLPVGGGNCPPSNFQIQQEQAAKRQQDILRDIYTNLHGVQACIFNPRFETSIYDDEDQDFHYPIVPDFEGKLMIEGLADALRYSGEDQWSMPEVTLYWSQPNVFNIQEDAKIVVNHLDQKVSFRAKNKRRQIGQHVEMLQVFQLVPYN